MRTRNLALQRLYNRRYYWNLRALEMCVHACGRAAYPPFVSCEPCRGLHNKTGVADTRGKGRRPGPERDVDHAVGRPATEPRRKA